MKQLSIQVVEGGYILDTVSDEGPGPLEQFGMAGGVTTKTEVFVSSGKLIKAVKTFLETKHQDVSVSEDA